MFSLDIQVLCVVQVTLTSFLRQVHKNITSTRSNMKAIACTIISDYPEFLEKITAEMTPLERKARIAENVADMCNKDLFLHMIHPGDVCLLSYLTWIFFRMIFLPNDRTSQPTTITRSSTVLWARHYSNQTALWAESIPGDFWQSFPLWRLRLRRPVYVRCLYYVPLSVWADDYYVSHQVLCALQEWKNGVHRPSKFDANVFQPRYDIYLQEINRIRSGKTQNGDYFKARFEKLATRPLMVLAE